MHEDILKAFQIKPSHGKISETTFISRIFGGYLRNQLRCPLCNYTSKTYNHFQDLSIDLAHPSIKSMESALAAFFKEEKLCNGNEWRCDSCKKRVQVHSFHDFHHYMIIISSYKIIMKSYIFISLKLLLLLFKITITNPTVCYFYY